ncbi:unnamed protein product, partial [Bubo scandiacus]
ILGSISLQKGLLGFGMGCPGRWWSPHPWSGCLGGPRLSGLSNSLCKASLPLWESTAPPNL